MKIKYPRTPRKLWAQVKITKVMIKKMREMRAAGYSFELIANEFDVSRSGVRRHLIPRFRQQLEQWKKDHPHSSKTTAETRRNVYHRKLKIFGRRFRNYQNQF